MNNNIDYLEYSINNEDNILLDTTDGKGILVINKNAKLPPNDLMKNIEKLNDLITTYYTVKNLNNSSKNVILNIINEIILLLDNHKNLNINYSPFCVYFQVLKYSFDAYKKSKLTNKEKQKLIKNLLDLYIENRYKMYKSYGYSHIILQVMADNSSSRRKGNLGLNLLSNILLDFSITNLNNNNFDSFVNTENCFIYSDKNNKKLFDEFIKNNLCNYNFRDNKYPDLLLKLNNHFFIIEHKLTNGSGGAQNSEINEIIEFISQKVDVINNNIKIHFVSCLQGNFFQYFDSNKLQAKKNISQKKNLVTALTNNPNNYFVNGNGLRKLIKCFVKKT